MSHVHTQVGPCTHHACLLSVINGQRVMCCQTWGPSVLHRLPHLQAPLHAWTGTWVLLQASGGAQLPYLWSPSVVHAEGKGKSYLDDFGSHPGMEKRSFAPGSVEAEAGSQDRAAHTDASRWGSAGLQHVLGSA